MSSKPRAPETFAWATLVCALVGGGVGCFIEPLDLGDKACDEEHPCAADYTCVDNICELDVDDSGTP